MGAVTLHQRTAQAIGILVQLLERGALGTDEPVAEHVLSVASDAHDLVAPQRDLEPAGRLAEGAGAERGAGRPASVMASSVPHPVTVLPRSVRHAPPSSRTHARSGRCR